MKIQLSFNNPDIKKRFAKKLKHATLLLIVVLDNTFIVVISVNKHCVKFCFHFVCVFVCILNVNKNPLGPQFLKL